MWEISLTLQIQAFLWSVFFGAVFCFSFDLMNMMEKALALSKPVVFVLDIAFFTILGLFDFCFFLVFSNGEIRGYIFVGEIIGFYLCKKTAAHIYMPIFLLLFGIAKKLISVINRCVFKPIACFFAKMSEKSLQISQKTLFFIKKCLKYPKRLVYTKEKCPKEKKG